MSQGDIDPRFATRAPGRDGLKRDTTGRPLQPIVYRIAMVIIAASLVFQLVDFFSMWQDVSNVASFMGPGSELAIKLTVLFWVAVVAFILNVIGLIGLYNGLAWARLLVLGVVVVHVVVFIVIMGGIREFHGGIGSVIWMCIPSVIVLVLLFAPSSTAYLRAMRERNARR